MSKILIGVMGPGGGAGDEVLAAAYELGKLIARRGWVLVTGGRAAGVMDAASRGAKEAGGLVVGILPGEDAAGASEFVDIPVVTGLGQARNNVNVLSSRAVVACGTGAGTAAEVALALKARRPVVLLNASREAEEFFKSIGGDKVFVAASPREAVEAVKKIIGA
ncbi:MAG: TIGR00725 family protein [Acidobacteriota bacterium]|nr:TIGR00725 family protein [Acidobacteriota bacterium]